MFFIDKRIGDKGLGPEDNKISIGVGMGSDFGIDLNLNIFDTVIPLHIIFVCDRKFIFFVAILIKFVVKKPLSVTMSIRFLKTTFKH